MITRMKMKYEPEFLEKLRTLCLEFDVKCDNWPEHELEGFALYEYARNPVEDPAEHWNNIEQEKDETGYLDEWFKLRGGKED